MQTPSPAGKAGSATGRRIRRWLGWGLGVGLGVGVILAAVVYALSTHRLTRTHPVPPLPKLAIPTDEAAIARGGHIATSFGNCTFCHGADLGGKLDSSGGPVVRIASPNLTRGRGGLGATFTDADWVRAIRHGVRRDGSSLILMPSETLVKFTESDLTALIAYLKQLPPVDREMPLTRLLPLGRVLLVAGKLTILVAEKTPHLPLSTRTLPERTPVYGQYLADISGCRGCHGLHLSGGGVHGPPGTPPAPNITRTGIGTWREGDLVRLLRTGKRPNGKALHPSMPWRTSGLMTDDEIHAVWLYLRSVPPRPFGNR